MYYSQYLNMYIERQKKWVVVYFIKALFDENSSNNGSKAVNLIIL